jgi:hypothetical protein
VSRLPIAVLFVTSAALAAPVPKGKEAELYFPTQVGAKRVMDAKLKSNQPGWTETVTKVEEKDGKYAVTIERDDGRRKTEAVYEVSKDGLYRKTTGGKVEAEPVLMLKLPYKEGTTWTAERPGPSGAGGPKAKVTYTMGKEEEVEVAAGKYKAFRLESEAESGGQTRKQTDWYAAGVGLVKTVMPGGVIELKEFTPGKEEKK